MQRVSPIYNSLIILTPFMLFLLGNNDSVNLYQKIIVILVGLLIVSIFYISLLIINALCPKHKNWMRPFLSISIFIAFSYAQWNLDNKLYAFLFLVMPLLIAISISRIYFVEKFFSTLICVMFVVISSQFIYLQYNQYASVKKESSTGSSQLSKSQISTTPNIYLVLLDAYSRKDTLAELGFDNSKFIDFLKTKDFFVADKSNANYISTRLSLFTLYMMKYPEAHITYKSPELNEVLKGKNSVISKFRSLGYTHVRMGPNQSFPQDCSGIEDVCLYKINEVNGTAYGYGNIFIHLLSMSPLLKLIKYFDLLSNLTNPDRYVKATIKNADESLQNRANQLQGPLFVEINVWQPHAPYLFQEDCDRRPEIIVGLNAWVDSSKKAYIDEIVCANIQLIDFVNNITRIDEKGIVIIMSDHGHSFFFDRETKVEDYSEASMRARLSNLVTAKLPSHCSQYLYSSITPVNIFPIVFACLKNVQPTLLNDLSFKHQLGNNFKSTKNILVETRDE